MSTTPEPAKRHYGPAIPRWMLPTVHVRRQGDIVTVEQRVPARVESIHTSSRDDSSHTSHNGHNEYHTPIYEAGLGSPTSLPLVKERLTVPASTVSEQQVRQAVDRAITAYSPGTAALSVQINRDALIRLLQTVAALGLAGIRSVLFPHSLPPKHLNHASRRPFCRFPKDLYCPPRYLRPRSDRPRGRLRSCRMDPAYAEVRG